MGWLEVAGEGSSNAHTRGTLERLRRTRRLLSSQEPARSQRSATSTAESHFWTQILQGFNQLPRTSQPAPKRRRRWPPAAWCLWSPALVRLTKTTRTTSPRKAFESVAFKPPQKPCQILVSLFLSVVIS